MITIASIIIKNVIGRKKVSSMPIPKQVIASPATRLYLRIL
jgi:hypothetical protein